MIHHNDGVSQYVPMRYTDPLGKAGIEPSVGNVGTPLTKLQLRPIYGLYKNAVIGRRGSRKTVENVQLETLKLNRNASIAYRQAARLVQ
jgi:putative transposase